MSSWQTKLKALIETASEHKWFVVEWKKSNRATKWIFISAFGDEKLANEYAKTQQDAMKNGEIVRVRGSGQPK